MVKEIKKYLFAAGLFFAIFVFSPAAAQAATLYFSPSTGSHTVGDILTANVLVNTQGQDINNAEAVINFPTNTLEVVSVSKSGSIFSFWPEEPAFSNSTGTISFNGGLPTPGYNGGAGKIIGIVFRIKVAGSASVVCSSAAVRANDGFGTNVFQSCGQAQFTLLSKEQPTPSAPPPTTVTPPPSSSTSTPQPPQVRSNTHPDSGRWYANKNPDFFWTNPAGTTGVNILGDRNPDTDPGTSSDGNFNTYDYSDVDDGVWYFHIKLRNAAGWGPTGHFRFQIDTVAPSSFEIAPLTADAEDGKAKFELAAADATSGIDHYEISINGAPAVVWKDDGTGVYQTEILETGSYNMVVKAVDAAGNFVEREVDFAVVNNAPVSRAEGQGITFRISWAPFKTAFKYLGLGLLALLALWLLVYILRKSYKFLSGIKFPASGSKNLKKAFNSLNQAVRENIEILESAKSRRKLTYEEEEVLSSLKKASFAKINEEAVVLSSEGHHKIIEGTFDGQSMTGFDGKAYAVPPNYASKSKLVEGDMLKLTISEDGAFVYKQIAPVEREKKRGTLVYHDHGDYRVVSDNHAYKVLVSALTYYQAEPGDHVTIVVPRNKEAVWAAVDDVHKAPPKPVEFIEPKKPAKKRTTRKTKKTE